MRLLLTHQVGEKGGEWEWQSARAQCMYVVLTYGGEGIFAKLYLYHSLSRKLENNQIQQQPSTL